MKIIYSTFPSRDKAIGVGKVLVRDQLVACINIIDSMTSIYVWEGSVNTEKEVVMIAKTNEINEQKVFDAIRSLHPYDCPALFSIEASSVESSYRSWLESRLTPEEVSCGL